MLAMAELGVIISRREAQVREGEQRFRLLVNEVQDYAIFMLDPAGRVVSWNAGAERLKGYRAEEILGEHCSRFYLPEDVAQGKPERQLQIATIQGRAEDEGWRLRRDGSRFRAHVVITAVHDAAGALVGFTKVTRDVTELRRTEAELAQYRGQLRALAARIESAQEEERSRIAREIHDELGQALTILKLDLGWLRANLPRRPAVTRRIRAMDEILDRTLDALRRLAADLRPAVLDQLGLRAAIRSLARDFEARTGVRAHVDLAAADVRLDPDLATTAYRILQEALTNVARHAGASRVDIALRVTPQAVSLEVRDDGRGITPRELASPGSLGLLGMRERARSWGGDVHISAAPERGTIVRATLPRRAQVQIAG
jgi:PAS domain S-box-containing protein